MSTVHAEQNPMVKYYEREEKTALWLGMIIMIMAIISFVLCVATTVIGLIMEKDFQGSTITMGILALWLLTLSNRHLTAAENDGIQKTLHEKLG